MAQPADASPSTEGSRERPNSPDAVGQQAGPAAAGGAVAALIAFGLAHPPVVLTALSSMAVVVRVLAVSDYDTTTALALLTGGAGPTLVFGSLLGVVTLVAMGVAVGAWMFRSEVSGLQSWVLDGVFVVAVITSLALVPVLLVAGVALLVVVGTMFDARRRSPEVRTLGAALAAAAVLALIASWLFLPFNSWLAPERISLKAAASWSDTSRRRRALGRRC